MLSAAVSHFVEHSVISRRLGKALSRTTLDAANSGVKCIACIKQL